MTPDVPAEVHIHGYEIAKDVKAGQAAKFHFTASLEGVFETEVHTSSMARRGPGSRSRN